MPFGLMNALACFQSFIQWISIEYLDVFCFVYLDDILIFLKTEANHLLHIEEVLAALSKNQITASPDEFSYFQTSGVCLGFVITISRISMDPEKLKKISDWSFPIDLKGLQHFLGFTNFYRRFIEDFSGVAAS